MTVKIKGMELPESCRTCRFCIHKTETVGECLALPIKDLDNEIATFQNIHIYPGTALGDERNKHCPLQEVKE